MIPVDTFFERNGTKRFYTDIPYDIDEHKIEISEMIDYLISLWELDNKDDI